MFLVKRQVVGLPSAVSVDFVQSADKKIFLRTIFPISELSCKCSQTQSAYFPHKF
jgi:hypothetical protein